MASGTRTYGDCSNCNRSVELLGSGPFIRDASNFSRRLSGAGYIRDCADCHTTAVYTTIRSITIKASRSVKACGHHCTNGKHSCDCRCGGRCHGAGTCYCEED